MGCKLHLLIGSLHDVKRAGNILMSFNNYPVRQAIPGAEQFAQLDLTNLNKLFNSVKQQFDIKTNLNLDLNLEFSPSPAETLDLITEHYEVRRNLLIKFRNDEIDQTLTLNPLLRDRFNNMTAFCQLPGNHLTPLGQEINWKTGEVFTPLDAVGQWVKESFSKDLLQLKQEILHWLNPGVIQI
jgi:hypothetical protein